MGIYLKGYEDLCLWPCMPGLDLLTGFHQAGSSYLSLLIRFIELAKATGYGDQFV